MYRGDPAPFWKIDQPASELVVLAFIIEKAVL
jgi:hypothetical protein